MTEELKKIIVEENGQRYEYLGTKDYVKKQIKGKKPIKDEKPDKKAIYDWCVKEQTNNENDIFLKGENAKYGYYIEKTKTVYDRYFSIDMKLEDKLSDKIKERFYPNGKKTSGNEINSGKFYSVASSSRFAVASFTKQNDKGKLDYIRSIKINGKKEEIITPEFEHDTPVNGIPESSRSPQVDFFFKTKNGTYFIEVKNHEILDSHKQIKISYSYLENNTPFKKLGLNEERGKAYEKEDNGSKYISLKRKDKRTVNYLLASDFGCELKTFHFDFKQFLCHLMGIISYAENHKEEKVYFYYLFYYNEDFDKNYDKKHLYEELKAEVKTIFDVFKKRIPKNIHLGFCYHDKYDTLKKLNVENID